MLGSLQSSQNTATRWGQIKCYHTLIPALPPQLIARITDIFEVEPTKMCVASRSHAFVTVTFTPQTMQTYQCIFEATLDGLPRYQLPSMPPAG